MIKLIRKCLVFVAALVTVFFTAGKHDQSVVDASLVQRNISLCSKDEKVIFTCPVKPNNKIVSLCASTHVTKTDGYLQYRFGTPAKIELEFPKERTGSQKAFEYNHYFRAKVDLTEISFSIDDYGYTLFDTYNGEEKPPISEQGVTVTRPNGQRDVTYSCRTKAEVDFGNLKEVLENRSSP